MKRRTFTVSVLAGAAQAVLPGADGREMERSVFAAVNRARTLEGLPVLAWSDRVAGVARRHSEEMGRRGFFGHFDPKRGTLDERLRVAGIDYRACGENLYGQSSPAHAAEAAVTNWMRSRGHRANLLKPVYRATGVGIGVDADGRCAITQVFVA